MNTHLRRLLDGFRQALTVYPGSDYVIPKRGDFRRDAAALRGDASRVAEGLRRNARRTHEPAHPR